MFFRSSGTCRKEGPVICPVQTLSLLSFVEALRTSTNFQAVIKETLAVCSKKTLKLCKAQGQVFRDLPKAVLQICHVAPGYETFCTTCRSLGVPLRTARTPRGGCPVGAC